MLTVTGYALALLMGLTLGLIGAGGSILTVPILVYFLHVKPEVATGYSLLIVGCAAFIGAWRYCLLGLVRFGAVFTFMLPAMLAVRYTRSHIVPALPEEMVFVGVYMPKDTFLLLMFALLMLVAGLFMLRPAKDIVGDIDPKKMRFRLLKLVLGSAGIGLLTGMVGAGGGFLIIPTLIGLFGLGVKDAVGTSLAIIAVNSLYGFTGDLASSIPLDYRLLGTFLLLTSAGMWAGTALSSIVEAKHLRKGFGWFVLVIAVLMLLDNILLGK